MSKEIESIPQKPENRSVQLHGNGLKAGSLIEQSLTRLNEQETQNLLSKAAEEALRLEVKSREQNLDYIAGKKSIEDHVDTFNMLEKRGRLTRQSVTSDVKTGAGNMRIESKSGATCFVASVAYDNPNHPDVQFLRGLRDEKLSKSAFGRSFISWYWRNGPKIAKIVDRSKILKSSARFSIAFIVKSLRRGS